MTIVVGSNKIILVVMKPCGGSKGGDIISVTITAMATIVVLTIVAALDGIKMCNVKNNLAQNY